jgi:hypothetical protein
MDAFSKYPKNIGNNTYYNAHFIRIVILPKIISNTFTYSLIDKYIEPSWTRTRTGNYYISSCKCDNDIILSEPYPLYNLKTIQMLGLQIDSSYVKGACAVGNIELLTYLFINYINMFDDHATCLHIASTHGHLHVLNWWKNSKLPIHFSNNLLHVPHDSCVNILEWWRNTGAKIECYHESLINHASIDGHIEILNWWKNLGIPLKYDPSFILCIASERGHVKVLEWWKKSGLPLDNLEYWGVLDTASENNHINVLEWWKNSDFIFHKTYSQEALDKASENGHIDVLNWWISSEWWLKHTDTRLKYSCEALDNASANGHIKVLEWWFNNKLSLIYSDKTLDKASLKGHVNVLEWWVKSNLPLKYSGKALAYATYHSHVNVLEWWFNSGLELKYSDVKITKDTNIHVLQFWKNTGLLPHILQNTIDINTSNKEHICPNIFEHLSIFNHKELDWIIQTAKELKNK